MKDEIKEINKEEQYIIIGNTKYYGIATELLDYITDLQENENLKSTMEELCEYAKKSDKLEIRNGMLRNENKELKEKNEKYKLIIKALEKYFTDHEYYEESEFLRQLLSVTENDMVWLKRMAGKKDEK